MAAGPVEVYFRLIRAQWILRDGRMMLKCSKKLPELFMRIFSVFLPLVIQLGWPAVIDASYVIRLKNGNEFVTGRYWQEGRQVMFDSYEGVFGVDKTFVSIIYMSNKPPAMAPKNPEVTQEKSNEPVLNQENKMQKAATSPEVIREKDDSIQKEFDALKAHSASVDGMLTSELMEYAKKLAAFKKKLQLEGKTNDYLREYGEIHEMGDAVEAALKKRR
jgi:hypothetical protein